ncbi:YIF1B [Cordylochernes scorpioides]|uniref:Protein YIF1 n=1 Tax=Cordylochernes scorpioides TaxID=51811 RepID=A0ABY6LJA7_9ARAC|nr:YIF1B [Cordylochernes scorpioides]
MLAPIFAVHFDIFATVAEYPSMRNTHRGGYTFPPHNPQLFEDTSYPQAPPQYSHPPPADWGYGGQQPPPAMFPGQQLLNDPMAAMAVNQLAGQSKEYVNQKIEKYVSFSKLKYYFAVDSRYVAKKLGLIFFPFLHHDWAIKFNQDEPIAPRYDVNAPDLYIPSSSTEAPKCDVAVMGFVTFVVTSGYLLGTQNRFTPEQLGYQASSAFLWLLVEMCAVYMALYLLSLASALHLYDLAAFASYKFVCIIAALLASIPLGNVGYLGVLGYTALSLGYFLLKSLRVVILPVGDQYTGGRRSLYLLLAICLGQPFLMFWLSNHLLPSSTPPLS